MQSRENYDAIPKCPSAEVMLFHVVDSRTKEPLAGTVFELIHKNRAAMIATTGKSGSFSLERLHPGDYELVETTAASGYLPMDKNVNIKVSECGCAAINGIPANCIVLENTRAGE